MVTPTMSTELPNNAGTLYEVVQDFTVALATLQKNLDDALAAVEANPSDPGALAKFQAASGDYTTYKSFLTNMIKMFRDIDAAIIRNI